ncbi:uncharacterized protein LOC126553601 [Aphis gossypii]|uniref:uncharacterized protein LOC126553601 n=1 Tax=Aphis gossypii TaxID=80765 RepID=UPI0021590E1D|nr:uncharacterized protein LOC126553601 [Aphis gossypii]XP_050064704.1 uncharacterized protein LOC126553601 [Aphis gossypii]
MEKSDTDSEYESGALGPPTKKKLRTEIVHKKCVTIDSRQDFKPSETQSIDNESRRLNKAPKTSAERGREFRARKALLKQQCKQQQELDAIVEIATDDIQSAGPSENNQLRTWIFYYDIFVKLILVSHQLVIYVLLNVFWTMEQTS